MDHFLGAVPRERGVGESLWEAARPRETARIAVGTGQIDVLLDEERFLVGDHIWWIGDNGRFESHYPDWKLQYDARRISRRCTRRTPSAGARPA